MPTTSLDRRLEAVLAAAEPRPAAVAIGAAAEARALLHAALARRARARRDREACRADGPATDELVGSYVEVFARKGLPADPAAVRLNLDAHFAARYRDLRLLGARNPATFEAALATSLALLDRAGTVS